MVVAGGDESMSRQPFLDYAARDGWRLGPRQALDGTLSLVTDPFEGYPMGMTAEIVAERYGVSREQQDGFALRSQERAAAAIEAGHFEREIVSVTPPRTEIPFLRDEHPRADTTVESLAALRPAFKRDGGTVTAGNSAGINDGAAALVLMRASEAERRGLAPRLVLRSVAVSGIEPEVMGYAPALAIPKALTRAGLRLADIDLVELNEAFAAQAVPVIRDAGLDPEAVNVSGGAIALGHPVGATGAILTVKLMHALEAPRPASRPRHDVHRRRPGYGRGLRAAGVAGESLRPGTGAAGARGPARAPSRRAERPPRRSGAQRAARRSGVPRSPRTGR